MLCGQDVAEESYYDNVLPQCASGRKAHFISPGLIISLNVILIGTSYRTACFQDAGIISVFHKQLPKSEAAYTSISKKSIFKIL